MVTYFSWWYGQGFLNFWNAILIMTEKVYSFFSVTILLRTIFDPWKRDEYTIENASLEARMRIWANNILSRVIGFVIRLFTIVIGFLVVIIFFFFFLTLFLIWLTLPLVVIGLIINGARMVLNG